MRSKTFLLFLFLIFIFSTISFADIYVYIAKDGQKVISNFKPYDYQKIIKIIKSKKHFYKANLKNSVYKEKIIKISKKYGVDPKLVESIIKVESDFKETAVSRKGAKGLMQLMEETAKDYGVSSVDIFDPEKNLTAGIRHLKRLINKYGINNLEKVLAAYNAGETAVDNYDGIPPYKETINYVKKVFKIYKGKTPSLKVSHYKRRSSARKSRIKVYYDKDGVLCITNLHSKDRR